MLPDVPTVSESGVRGFDVTVWYAVLAAAGQVVAVREQGQVVGLRVTTTDVAHLERLGLRRDDIITAINGVPVREADLGAARLAALLQGARPTLRLRRGGRILELTPGT